MVDPAPRTRNRLTLIAMPFAIMTAIVIARVILGPGAGLLPLLALGPALAGVGGGLRHTMIVGGVALGLTALLAFIQNPYSVRQEAIASAVVAGVTVASVVAGWARQRRDRELADVRAVAEVAQEVLLREVPPKMGPVALAVRYISASSRARIGGDLYEILTGPAGVRLIVGDVEGKGLSAVQTAATVLGTFREAVYDEPSLERIAARIEASMARQHADEHFVTAVLAQVSPDGSKVELLNCGHPSPLLIGPGGPRFLDPADNGLPLGLSHLADFPRTSDTIPFTTGDWMLLYTDGITEARNTAGEFFPLASACCLGTPADPTAVLDQLSEKVRQHAGGTLDDDAAMLLVRREQA